MLVRAGLPIRTTLERLQERMAVRELTVLSEKVNAGERLGDAFTAAGFSPFECHLVTAGERSAQLDTIFEHLSEHWARELKMRHAMVQPLYYPLAVLHLAIVVGGIVEATTTAWPVVAVHFIMALALLYTICLVVYVVARVMWSSPIMRRVWLHMPIIGNSLRTTYAYRWITALRLEFAAGVSLSRAVGDAWRASGYIDCDRFAEEGEQAMREKVNLSKLVAQWKQLPRDWADFIATAEISGAFEEVFKNLETETAHAWSMAQQRMTEWLPKIAYFFVLLIAAVVIINLFSRVLDTTDIQKQIDNAVNGK